jgi:hypothetical protein
MMSGSVFFEETGTKQEELVRKKRVIWKPKKYWSSDEESLPRRSKAKPKKSSVKEYKRNIEKAKKPRIEVEDTSEAEDFKSLDNNLKEPIPQSNIDWPLYRIPDEKASEPVEDQKEGKKVTEDKSDVILYYNIGNMFKFSLTFQ